MRRSIQWRNVSAINGRAIAGRRQANGRLQKGSVSNS